MALSPKFSRIAPPVICPCGRCNSCISDRLVTDLPQPDSPTTPTVLPWGTSKDTPLTALTTPMSVKKLVDRLSNSTTLLRPAHFAQVFALGHVLAVQLLFSSWSVTRRFSREMRRDSRALM